MVEERPCLRLFNHLMEQTDAALEVHKFEAGRQCQIRIVMNRQMTSIQNERCIENFRFFSYKTPQVCIRHIGRSFEWETVTMVSVINVQPQMTEITICEKPCRIVG